MKFIIKIDKMEISYSNIDLKENKLNNITNLNLIDLFESNSSKLKAIQDKYFCRGTNNSMNLISSSDWLIPKEKFYTRSNYIVTGKIISVKKENNKNVYVEIRLERVVAICYDGDNLSEIPQKCYMNFSQRSGVNSSFINSFEKFYENLWEYNIVGYIRKHDIYDSKIPHLNDDIDYLLREDNLVTCIIIKNKLSDDLHSHFQPGSYERTSFLQLSFKNSIIKYCKQYFLSYVDQTVKIPFILGIKYCSGNKNLWINNTDSIMPGQSNSMNESIIRNLVNNLNLSEYDTVDLSIYSTKINDISAFSYDKIRKAQNYEWADDYFKKGVDMMALLKYEKAIDYFKDAEKLDSLNKDIYCQKGLCYLKIDQYQKAKKEFKSCLKIEPNDEIAKKYLLKISSTERNSDDLNKMLNKKRHEN